MNNHYHMAVEVSEDDLSEGMREINHRYALLFNKTQGKSGHLFQDRFHSKIVSDDYYMMELSRYIVLNPVRASIVPAPQLWPWSSYSDLLSGTGIAEHGFVLSLFSDDCDSALAEYNEFISEATGETFQWNEIRDYLFGAGKLPRPSLAAIFNGSKGRDIHIAEARFLHGYKLREIADFLSMSNAQIHRLAKSNRELIWKEMPVKSTWYIFSFVAE